MDETSRPSALPRRSGPRPPTMQGMPHTQIGVRPVPEVNAELWPEFRLGYARLVTITTDGLREANEFRDQVGASWPFLCDPERLVQRELDIAEYTDPDHDPMVPHTFVLAPGLRIHAIYNGYWFWGRPTNDDLRRDLREVTRLARPDWDLATPGLRERWDAGDRSGFWPYGRPVSELIAERADPASET